MGLLTDTLPASLAMHHNNIEVVVGIVHLDRALANSLPNYRGYYCLGHVRNTNKLSIHPRAVQLDWLTILPSYEAPMRKKPHICTVLRRRLREVAKYDVI